MSQLEIEDQIRDLRVGNLASLERGVERISAALPERRRDHNPRLRQIGVAGVIAVAFFTATAPGRDVAVAAGNAAGNLVGISDFADEEQEAKFHPYLERTEAFDELLGRLALKADAGELNADVDQAAAAETLREALDPPQDPAAARDLQDRMIALTEALRAAGDMPRIGAPTETFSEYGQ